jgi:hypothetical protein
LGLFLIFKSFLRGARFSGEQKPVFCGANCSSMVLELRWSSLTLSPRKWRSGKELLWSSRTTLEQIAPWVILLLQKIPLDFYIV